MRRELKHEFFTKLGQRCMHLIFTLPITPFIPCQPPSPPHQSPNPLAYKILLAAAP